MPVVQERRAYVALGALNAEHILEVPVTKLAVTVAGTFAGTVQVQRRAPDADGTWVPVQSFTAAGFAVYDFATSGPVRVRMTVYTSGTAQVLVEGAEIAL